MTGFATMEEIINGKRLFCLVRTLNHRYLDMTFRLGEDCQFLEPLIRELIRQYFTRGKIELRLSIEEETPHFLVHENALDALLEALSAIRDKAIDCPLPDALAILSYQGVLKKSGLSEEEKKELVLTVLEKALSETQKARAKEGEALQASLLSQVKILFDLLEDTKAKLTVVLPDYKAKLTQKIKELAEHIDEARLAQEMAIYLQKIDIDEELVRLQIHLKEIEQLLQNGGVVGKKIDFIVQELNREANTLAAKAANIDIAQNAVKMKQVIEQMREQVQNIE